MMLRLAQIVLALTLLVVLAGVTVRATGSGLGCPDWPMCWGYLIPPTELSEAEAEAFEQYARDQIESGKLKGPYDPEIHGFNATNTWIEYINRLLTVVMGLFLLALALGSLLKIHKRPWVAVAAWVTAVLVGFQAWLGKEVVASGLEQQKISVHFFVALGILAAVCLTLQLLNIRYSKVAIGGRDGWPMPWRNRRNLLWSLLIFMAICWAQMVLGTMVRAELGSLTGFDAQLRSMKLAEVGVLDSVHRTGGVLSLFVALWFWLRLSNQLRLGHPARFWGLVSFILVILQMVMGLGLAYSGVPPLAQVAHVWLAALLATAQFLLLFGFLFAPDPARVGVRDERIA